ncbi:prephenate dehydratase [Methanocaldococcus indicus]|uniref:prephenate dehydratase n=1 Tax=Methanocaldococcus indicus TaxID=213231 RepID=UPI003C6D891F
MEIYTLQKGSYLSMATKKFLNFLNNNFKIKYCPTIYNIFENLGFGVVPIENSIEGSVTLTQDLLLEFKPKILAELVMPIHHCLIGYDKKKIKTIISHPQAIAQCRKYIKMNNWNVKFVDSTAKAVEIVAKSRDETLGAIASEESAKIFNLNILDRNIEDYKNNVTRFILIGYDNIKIKNKDAKLKSSIVFELKEDKPGALYHILKEFAERDINLTRIESRPSKKRLGTYIFYIDYEYKESDVLESIKKYTNFIFNFGVYPSIVID